ncbi:uncharacterized protein [Nicotiana tomentosiformis]|uniref:uncharacterized protein n=1 Tax=Nicotiana tomentosiformis TaxID=4098 RepID=UPI00388C3A06
MPVTLREEYRKHFERLQQGGMTVTQYETQFVDLARHATIMLPNEKEKLRRFIDGLTYTIRLQMAKETMSDIFFQTAVDITRQIKMVRAQERGQVSDKRPHYFGGFSGASSRGRGNFSKVHALRPFQLPLRASHNASGSRGPYVPYSRQLAYNALSTPISAHSI